MPTDLNQLNQESAQLAALANEHLAKRRSAKGRVSPSLRAEQDIRIAFLEAYVAGYEAGVKFGIKHLDTLFPRPRGFKEGLS